jgi:hypothetical protein
VRKSEREDVKASRRLRFAATWPWKVVLADGDRGLQQLRERHRPEAGGRLGPRRERPGHTDGHAARHALREERDRLVGGGVDEGVGGKRLRRGLAPVDRDHAVLVGEVDDHEPAAADARDERLGDAEHGIRSDGGVDRVAALAQHADAGPRCVRVDARDCSARPDRDRLLRRLRRRRSAAAGGEHGNESCERDEQ